MSSAVNSWLFLLVAVVTVDKISGAASIAPYHERHRPQIHYSPERNFCNDPNGLVYYEGEYHLFYQYGQEPNASSLKHWGHAYTTDLLHWHNLPVALAPNGLGEIFSGSAVMDYSNSTGTLRQNETAVMIAMFTQRGKNNLQQQSIAFSHDKGRTFQFFEANPVIKNPGIVNFRDPKVRWHNETSAWVLVLASGDRTVFYKSKDLKQWNKTGEFVPKNIKGVVECPDIIPFQTEDGIVWVHSINWNPGGPNLKTGTQYVIGNFDGYTFTAVQDQNSVFWADYGPDSYAGVTWNNVDPKDGRTLFIGWMNTWVYADKVPTNPWKGAMTTVRYMRLIKTKQGYRLSLNPIKEYTKLITRTLHDGPVYVENSEYFFLNGASIYIIDFTVNLDDTTSSDFGIKLSNAKGEYVIIGFLKLKNTFYIDRSKSGDTSFSPDFRNISIASRITENVDLKVTLVVDVASVELFADDGLTVMTATFFPTEDFHFTSIFAHNGSVFLNSVDISQLQSIW